MKVDIELGYDEANSHACHAGEGLQRLERTSSHDLGKTASRAITSTADAVTPPDDHDRQPGTPDELESTRTLLDRTRGGDSAARELLIRRYLPQLNAWAHGRLPKKLRRQADTDDLVQETFLKALDHVDHIEFLHEGGFLAYLRTILRNLIVDLIRRKNSRPEDDSIPEGVEEVGPSPFAEAVGIEIVEDYEAALDTLSPQQRAAVMCRIELGLSFQEVADAVGCPSANAARMLVARAIVRLSEVMNDPR